MKNILYYSTVEQTDSFSKVWWRGEEKPYLIIETRGNKTDFGAKKHTGGQLRSICRLAKNGRDTEVK